MKAIHGNVQLPLPDQNLCRQNKKKEKKSEKKLGRKHKTSRPTDGMPNNKRPKSLALLLGHLLDNNLNLPCSYAAEVSPYLDMAK